MTNNGVPEKDQELADYIHKLQYMHNSISYLLPKLAYIRTQINALDLLASSTKNKCLADLKDEPSYGCLARETNEGINTFYRSIKQVSPRVVDLQKALSTYLYIEMEHGEKLEIIKSA